jgi:hypothetical protein
MKAGLLVVAVLSALAVLLVVRDGARAQPEAVIATFDVLGETFRVRVENADTIEQVRALERGESTASIPNGRLLRGDGGVNQPWSWHLDPNDIEMAEFAIELCDGTPSMVEEDLDYWVDTVGRYCPWSGELVSVEEDEEKQQSGICIDPIGTFSPRAILGGCIPFETGKDQVLVIGRALLGNDYAPSGTQIQALAGDTLCGQGTGGSKFTLLVLGAAEREGCAGSGESVRFVLDGQSAEETFVWPENSFGFAFLSLTAVDRHAWYWFERTSVSGPALDTVVQGFVAGQLCGKAMIRGEDDLIGFFFVPPGIRGFSRLIVPHSDLQPGCAENGSLVEFRVGGLRAETAVVWQSGVHRLDLLVQGDATCDFLVDPRDATLVLQHTARLVDDVACHGDADRDHDLDAIDARHILEFAAGITTALPL